MDETIKVVLEIDKETFNRIKGYVEIDHFEHDIVGYTMKRLADGTILNEGKAEDCISREAVLENAYAYGNGLEPEGYCVNVEDIQALPPVTPQEPKTGKWISTETKGVRYAFWCRYKCSLCGGLSDHTNFCPNCGAKMVEPKESEG